MTEGPLYGDELARQVRAKKLELRIQHDDLTATATSEAIPFAVPLPATALVIARQVEVTTAMSGGSVSACVIDVGVAGGDTDSLIDGENVFTGATAKKSGTAGILPVGDYGGATLQVLVAATDDDVADLTAGDITVTVWYLEVL